MDYSDIMLQYAVQQRKNEIIQQGRRREVYKKIPDVENLEKKIKQLLVTDVQKALKTSEFVQMIKANRKKAERLKNSVEELLTENGFPGNYLDNIYRCEKCRDTGYVGNAVKKRCACMEKKLMDIALKNADLNAESGRFEKFDENVFSNEITRYNKTQKQYMRSLKKYLLDFANAFPDTPKNTLLIVGAAGLGKTFLLECIANQVIQKGYAAGFFTAYSMFDAFYKHRLNQEIDLNIYFDVPLLLVDDLGTEPLTNNVTVEYFFGLLNERQRAAKHTAIASNLNIQDIRERYGERVYSRIVVSGDAKVYCLEGRDIRKKGK